MVVTPHIYLLLLIMLCLLMLDKLHSELTDKGINYEVVALINLKAEISDPHNELANWDGNEVDPCNWSFVICSTSRFVTKLVLSKSQLSGFLSPSIANLTLLESLMLKDNNFSGLIPEEIGKLSKLNNLDLSNNHFIGPIPRTLDGLKNLRTLRLNNNSLTGPIPPSIVNLPLDIVELSFNNLSGSIPNISNTKLNIVGNPLLCGSDATTSCSANAMLPVSSRISSTSQGSGSSSLKAIIIGVVVGAFFTSLLVSLIILLLRRHRQKQDDAYEMQDPEFCYGQIRKFTYRELQTATDNFNTQNILGKGGFAYVYKGTLSDGTIVAVKRLNDKNTVRGEVQFQTEVKMISLAVHRHLLRLLGYCVNGSERILVYPFMPNGSVASRLRETPALDWATRRKIALGSGRGLMYLHEQCDPKIIHRDVKAANILLDKDFEAVVGDFGLAKLLDHKDSHVTTAVLGTVGHIAPEYLTSGQSSEKTDVFGFGIFLLELITGQRAIDFGRRKGQQGNILLDWKCLGCYDPQVKTLQQEARLLELVDPAIKDCYNPAELEAVAQVTLLCTQFIPSDRPRMAEVIRMLEGDGLSERWEAWQRGESDRLRDSNDPRLQTYYDLAEDDSVALSGVQLSGPR